MAMVNLSKGFSRKASSGFDGDREEHDKLQATAVVKAINCHVSAVKEKHLRTLILGTYRDRGAGTFWCNVIKLPLEGDPVVSWKFCHALHKLLRDGEAHVLTDSLKYKTKLVDLGRLWKHVRDDSCQLISSYCNLLITKLEFHQRARDEFLDSRYSNFAAVKFQEENSQIPGNLVLTEDQLEAIGRRDVNNWFEFSIEILDYLDAILALQKTVFDSLDKSRASSMTPIGQCRLAPMILCILDSSSLYDTLVKIMFKLYASLPADLLSGHTDRFLVVFKGLKQFYVSSSNLQYFKYLVSVPTFPETPPNFSIASDFGNYVSPEVLLHDRRSDSPTDSQMTEDVKLVDISDASLSISAGEAASSRPQSSSSWQDADRDQEVNSLRHALDDARMTIWRASSEHEKMKSELCDMVNSLKEKLVSAEEVTGQLTEENDRLRQMNEQLQNEKNHLLDEKSHGAEAHIATMEEKFRKLKEAYNNLREEHIKALKTLTPLQTTKGELEAQCRSLEMNLEMCRQQLEQQTSIAAECEEKVVRLQADSCKTMDAKQQVEMQLATMKQQQENLVAIFQRIFAMVCRLGKRMIACGGSSIGDGTMLNFCCPPEMFVCQLQAVQEELDSHTVYVQPTTADSFDVAIIESYIFLFYQLSILILYGRGTANVIETDQVDDFRAKCGNVVAEFSAYLEADAAGREATLLKLKSAVSELCTMARTVTGAKSDLDADQLAEMYESEVKLMESAILEAAAKIDSILSKTRTSCSGVRLEVHERILESCTDLIGQVMQLVICAKNLQNEIVQQQRGSGSVTEFYKRNHEWTEGLLSAAKAVGSRANLLVDAADRVVCQKGKFEELMAASKEIAASTVQLVVSSRVKADKESAVLHELSQRSKAVSGCVASVLENVKSGKQSLEEQDVDFSNLSLHQTKLLEMEKQIRVLELESLLEKERKNLGELRKHHYQLGDSFDDQAEVSVRLFETRHEELDLQET